MIDRRRSRERLIAVSRMVGTDPQNGIMSLVKLTMRKRGADGN